MATLYIWPNGDWAYKEEIFKPEPGFFIEQVSDHWTDDRIDEYVQQLVSKRNRRNNRTKRNNHEWQ